MVVRATNANLEPPWVQQTQVKLCLHRQEKITYHRQCRQQLFEKMGNFLLKLCHQATCHVAFYTIDFAMQNIAMASKSNLMHNRVIQNLCIKVHI